MAIACPWTEAVAKITATPVAVANPVFFWNIAMNTALYLFIASLLASFKGHLLKEGDRKSPIDALTGLHNIVGFHELAAVELQRSRSHGRQMTLIYFDCHSFRDLNPAGGISDNDAFLIAISRILKTSLRVSDLLFRWRENEFLFLLPETDQSAAMAVANYLRPTIKARGLEQGWIVTFSIGVAVYERLPADIDEMLTKAEQVMAEARRSSQNSIGFRIF